MMPADELCALSVALDDELPEPLSESALLLPSQAAKPKRERQRSRCCVFIKAIYIILQEMNAEKISLFGYKEKRIAPVLCI